MHRSPGARVGAYALVDTLGAGGSPTLVSEAGVLRRAPAVPMEPGT